MKISKDMHAHFLKLEDQVHHLESQIQTLNDNLSAAQSDSLVKENLVKQHAKVAEEAVSGNTEPLLQFVNYCSILI